MDLSRIRGIGMMAMMCHPKPELFYSMKELLLRQRKGQFLTPKEKERIKEYAEEQRKKNLKAKKN